jgi:hypothetical protein
MPVGRSGETSAAIAGWSSRRRADGGVKIQSDDAATRSGPRRSGPGGDRRRRRHDLGRNVGATRARSGQCALLGNRKLRRGSDDGAVSDFKLAQLPGGVFDAGWRRNHRGLRPAEGVRCRRRLQVGRRCNDGILDSRRNARHFCSKSGHGLDVELRLRRLIGPGNDIGQWDISVQLDVRRRDNGLTAIVRFARHGDDRLRRKLWVGLRAARGFFVARVNWGQIRVRLVNEDL